MPDDIPTPSLLDRAISWISPEAGNRRRLERFRAQQIHQIEASGFPNAWNRRPVSGERTSTVQALPGGSGDYFYGYRGRDESIAAARDLERRNPLAYSLLCRDAENVIGTGHVPKPGTGDPAWNSDAEGLWHDWANDPEQCDAQATHTFGTLQRMAWLAARRDGDVGIIKLQNGALQYIEADLIASPLGTEGNPLFIEGVEVNKRRRPKNFYVVEFNNVDPKWFAGYPRDLPGRRKFAAKDFIHFAHRTRFTQVRGMPGFVRAARYFDHLDGYIEASVMAARMAAIFGLVVKLGPQSSGFAVGGDTAKASTGEDYKSWHLEPAMTKVLNFGDEIEQVKAEHPAAGSDNLIRMIVRLLGLEWGMPLEVALLDFSQSNYSSSRASLLQAFLAWQCMGKRWENECLRNVYRWKIDGFIRAGLLPFREDRYRATWMGVGRGWVDPMKEVVADLIAVDAGFSTVSQVLRKRGLDFEDLVLQRSMELEVMRAAGIPSLNSKHTRDPLATLTPDDAAPDDAAPDDAAPDDNTEEDS